MVGTAGLPHLLTQALLHLTHGGWSAASVAWSLFFIALLYLSAPALAVLVKFEVMQNLVGSSFEAFAQPDGPGGRARTVPCCPSKT